MLYRSVQNDNDDKKLMQGYGLAGSWENSGSGSEMNWTMPNASKYLVEKARERMHEMQELRNVLGKINEQEERARIFDAQARSRLETLSPDEPDVVALRQRLEALESKYELLKAKNTDLLREKAEDMEHIEVLTSRLEE
ncbi:hypothetical protein B9Z65_1741 [Elsinoe australis]|uniref:Uncharacterized protein n=1 Tax=Elsinoe australis TaxID=40998 RepID=A0A2P7YKQ3_9PEZI|nr:hypothetical protein B9Z65_1741 [Elsinoe australis]